MLDKYKYPYLSIDHLKMGMIRSGMATPSRLFMVQMQDLLELGADARMNSPGTSVGNWQWRMLPGAADKTLAKKLKLYTTTYRR